jgi:hypothetical protein
VSAPPPAAAAPKTAPAKKPEEGGVADTIGDVLNSRQGKQVQREVIRGIFGMLKKKL